jgi:hypothetical protein
VFRCDELKACDSIRKPARRGARLGHIGLLEAQQVRQLGRTDLAMTSEVLIFGEADTAPCPSLARLGAYVPPSTLCRAKLCTVVKRGGDE